MIDNSESELNRKSQMVQLLSNVAQLRDGFKVMGRQAAVIVTGN
jgi:hypothetical protein